MVIDSVNSAHFYSFKVKTQQESYLFVYCDWYVVGNVLNVPHNISKLNEKHCTHYSC